MSTAANEKTNSAAAGTAAAEVTYDVSTVAGGAGQSGFVDSSAAASARFASPCGIAFDTARQCVYVSDFKNHAIRAVDIKTGAVSTIAGGGGSAAAKSGYRDGACADALFHRPRGIAVDPHTGSIVVADQFNAAIRCIDRVANTVTTLAGGNGVGCTNGGGAVAQFNMPMSVAVHPTRPGVVYVCDNESARVRVITTGAAATTAAATTPVAAVKSTPLAALNETAPASDSKSTAPAAAVTAAHIVRGAAPSQVSTLTGDGTHDTVDGSPADAKLDTPRYACVDDSGAVLFVTSDESIRRVDLASGAMTTVARSERLNPFGLAWNPVCRAIVYGDFMTHTISQRAIAIATAAATTATAASVPAPPAGTTSALPASKHVTSVLATAASTPAASASAGVGPVVRLAGGGATPGAVDGSGARARFNWPEAIAVDPQTGTLWVADSGNHTIRKLTPISAVATTASAVDVKSASA